MRPTAMRTVRFALRCAGALGLTLALAACSSDESTTSSSLYEQAEPNPVIVVMGGFNSCLTGANDEKTPRGGVRWARAEQLTSTHARGEERWVRSCFDKWGGLYYVSSAAPETVYRTSVSDPEPFYAAITDETNGRGRERPVYLMGHSHGGWLAMRAAWALPATSTVRLLYTVDPISTRHCTSANYLASIVSPGNSPLLLAGCRRAPTDVSRPERQTINSRLAELGWRHYYQLNFSPLHSSAYTDDAAPARSYDVSSYLNDDGVGSSWNAHTGIDDLSLIWTSLEASIGTDLGH